MKPRHKSKTYWLGFGVAVLGVIQLQLQAFGEIIPPVWNAVANMIVAVLICVMREITTGPVGKADE